MIFPHPNRNLQELELSSNLKINYKRGTKLVKDHLPKLTKIVVWGTSSHAKTITQTLILDSNYEIAGYMDSVNLKSKGKRFLGKRIFGGFEELNTVKQKKIKDIVLAFGHCSKRIEIGKMLLGQGFTLPVISHPSTTVDKATDIADGAVILAGAIIDCDCSIGRFTIINLGSVVSHCCTIGEGTHICPGVTIAGGTSIGSGCWIGVGSSIIDKVTIGDNVFIGAGAVVVSDIPPGRLVYGNPAKIIRSINNDF